MTRQLCPDFWHSRAKGDRHRRCNVCLGREHSEAALSGGPPCEFCASMTLARVTKCLAYWDLREAREPTPVYAEERLSQLDRAHLWQHAHRPVPDLEFGLESESLPDYSEGHVSDDDIDVEMVDEPRVPSPPVSCRTVGQQLHKVVWRAAYRLGLPLRTLPSTESSLLDDEYYGGPPISAPSPIPFLDMSHPLLGAFPSPWVRSLPASGPGQGEWVPLISTAGGCCGRIFVPILTHAWAKSHFSLPGWTDTKLPWQRSPT